MDLKKLKPTKTENQTTKNKPPLVAKMCPELEDSLL